MPYVVLVTCLAVAIVAVSFPVLIIGVPRSLPVLDPSFGLVAGAIAATATGPVAVGLLTGRDFDQGTRADRIALGSHGASLVVTQLLLALATVVATVVAGTLFVQVAALADRLVRSVTGAVATQHLADHHLVLLPMLPLAVTTIAWLLTVATRSGRRGLALLVATLASWAALAPAIAQSPVRDLLKLHPMALPWSLAHPFDSSRFDFTAPWWQLAPFTLVWLSALAWAAWRSSSRPGKRR